MADLEAVLDEAGLTNPKVREFVKDYAELTGAERIEVVNASDDARLLEEACEAGELEKVGEGRYYSRSYYKDTARSEERTIVATSDEKDRGVYNNWRPASEMKPKLHDLMRGASEGKTMYVVPYLMAPAGNALEPWAAGVEITDTRTVVLHMIRMARVGVQFVNDLEDPGMFVRAVHVSGDLENLGQGTDGDKRYFVTVADERTILHFGSSYGGNALLGKIAHGLRQGAYDGWASKKFLAEQYMLIGIHDKETGKDYHICGGFPSASGKTNLAMMAAPDALGDRYHVSFYGDDIAWLWVEEETGKLYGMNPEYGVFGVAKDTNEVTNPNALASVDQGTGLHLHQRGLQPHVRRGLVGGPHQGEASRPPRLAGLDGLARSRTARRTTRPRGRTPTVASPRPWPTSPTSPPTTTPPLGVPIDAIIFGGRTRDREPLIRAITDLAEGVYDGLTLGAEATVGGRGQGGRAALRPDVQPPVHGLRRGRLRPALPRRGRRRQGPADLRPRQLVPARRRGRPLPVARLPRQPAPAAVAAPAEERRGAGRRTAVGIIPTEEELDLEGMDIPAVDLERILTIDKPRWQQEMGFREEHLSQFDRMPEAIWEAHRRVAADLDDEA